VQPGDSLIAIAERSAVTLEDLQAENLIDPADTIYAGQVFDVCIGNDTDDITGASRLAPPPDAVMVQQRVLNELFADLALLPLGIDGDSGKYTRQAVCAARMGLGLPVHAGHLPAGSEEEAAIFAATDLGVPAGAPTDEDRWILVDQTCQVIVTGEADRLVNIFPTSTGSDGHATFNVRARAFRFDPATDNAGWHDSSIYPVEVDNPLNGNMYKPIYFNDGQAIHGAGFIPPEPRSKGCARTFPMHQDMIIEWLGIADMTEATWNVADIGVTVVVQGRYVDPTAAEPAAG
jgi:LysM domain/L,D-transpeptidase catalytic domain